MYYGMKDVQVKVIDCEKEDVYDLNSFLDRYNGKIIDIKPVPMAYGWTRYVVIYQNEENWYDEL